MQPLLGVKKLQAVVAARSGQHSRGPAARTPRALEEGADLAAAITLEGSGCSILASLCRERRGSRAIRDKPKASATEANTGRVAGMDGRRGGRPAAL